jgi:protease-4
MKKNRILRNVLAGGALLLLLAAGYLTATGGWRALFDGRRPLVLEIDLDEALPEKSDSLLTMAGMPEPLSLRGAIEALDTAARDPRVKVLVARICSPGKSQAHIQELRDAVTRFRAAGKKAIALARRSEKSDRRTVAIISRPRSMKSTCSRPGISASPDSTRSRHLFAARSINSE